MPDLLDEALRLHRLLAQAAEAATEMRLKIEFLEHEVDRLGLITKALEKENDRFLAALSNIAQWAKAYPLKVFPEPDFIKVRDLLAAGGITLDAVSASNMRHVVEGVGKIAQDAIDHAG